MDLDSRKWLKSVAAQKSCVRKAGIPQAYAFHLLSCPVTLSHFNSSFKFRYGHYVVLEMGTL